MNYYSIIRKQGNYKKFIQKGLRNIVIYLSLENNRIIVQTLTLKIDRIILRVSKLTLPNNYFNQYFLI